MRTASLGKKVICLLVLIALFVPLKDNIAEAAYTYQEKVDADVLNIRSKPGTAYSVTGKLTKNQVVTVVETNKSWSKVTFGKTSGWVSSTYLSPVTWTGYVTATSLNVRKSPSINSAILTPVKKDVAITVQGADSNWLKVYIPSKKTTGWVSASFVSNKKPVAVVTKSAPPTIQKVPIVLKVNSNLRTGPGTSYKVLAVDQAGTYMNKIGEKNGWTQVEKTNGTTGWLSSGLVRTTASVLNGKVIVLDPGHGGIDPGTIGRIFYEKALTLNSAFELGALLQKAGAKVVYTRSKDTYITLNQRVNSSHQSKADAFISLHYNACVGICSGIETFYYSNAQEGALARSIHSNLVSQTKLRDRGAKYGSYHVLRQNKQPAILVELGFLSNPIEERLVATSDYQKKAAQGINNGLFQYFLTK